MKTSAKCFIVAIECYIIAREYWDIF